MVRALVEDMAEIAVVSAFFAMIGLFALGTAPI